MNLRIVLGKESPNTLLNILGPFSVICNHESFTKFKLPIL